VRDIHIAVPEKPPQKIIRIALFVRQPEVGGCQGSTVTVYV
jgi:hypothetical protein